MIEQEQIVLIEDLRDPAINPAAKWLHGNHTKVTWVEPHMTRFWPVYVWDACSHDCHSGPIFALYECDITWLETEDSKIAHFISDLAKKVTNTP